MEAPKPPGPVVRFPTPPTSAAPTAGTPAATAGGKASSVAVPVAVGVAGGLLANWTINRWADLIDLDADVYVAEANLRDIQIRNAARRRKQQEHQQNVDGSPVPIPTPDAQSDPCEQISGPDLRHVNGAIAEQRGWESALSQGHIGVQGPGKITAPGPDFVTYNPLDDTIYAWDAKYRKEGGKYPCAGPSADKIGKWMQEIRDAINRLSDKGLRDKILRALERGRIRGELFKWP